MNRQYIVTERAHYMCPNMHFGIVVTINKHFDEKICNEVLAKLSSNRPFLNCLVAEDEEGRLYYNHREDMGIIKMEIMKLEETLAEDYNRISIQGWNVHNERLLKVLVYPEDTGTTENDGFSIVFVAHHLLCDGRGLLELAKAFSECYVKGTKIEYVEERLIKSLDDFSVRADMPWISKVVVNSACRTWLKEGRRVGYNEYMSFERQFCKDNSCSINMYTKDEAEVTKLVEDCHNKGVSINDYLIARMMVDEKIGKVVIAADIRKYVSCYNAGSLGNFSTAFGVECKPKSDVWELARDVARKVKIHMNTPKKLLLVLACYMNMTPELIDAVAISTLGNNSSKAGEFVGSKMFGYKDRQGYSITNLGKIESDSMARVVFIPPASPANREIVGVVTVNGVMRLCERIYS